MCTITGRSEAYDLLTHKFSGIYYYYRELCWRPYSDKRTDSENFECASEFWQSLLKYKSLFELSNDSIKFSPRQRQYFYNFLKQNHPSFISKYKMMLLLA